MEELAKTIVRILKLTIAAVVIGSVTLLAVVVTNWKNSPLSGWHVVKDNPRPEKPVDCNCRPVVDDDPPPRPVHRRRVVKAIEQPVEDAPPVEFEQPEPSPLYYRPAPIMARPAAAQQAWQRYEARAPLAQYNVIVVEKKHRGFFRSIGHGFAAVGRGVGRGAVKVVTFGRR
jgi:hypothetical protein